MRVATASEAGDKDPERGLGIGPRGLNCGARRSHRPNRYRCAGHIHRGDSRPTSRLRSQASRHPIGGRRDGESTPRRGAIPRARRRNRRDRVRRWRSNRIDSAGTSYRSSRPHMHPVEAEQAQRRCHSGIPPHRHPISVSTSGTASRRSRMLGRSGDDAAGVARRLLTKPQRVAVPGNWEQTQHVE